MQTQIAQCRRTAELVIGWDTACQRRQVTLVPSSTVAGNGYADGGPDAACSAEAVATGGKIGLASVADLPSSPVEVTLSLADATGAQLVAEANARSDAVSLCEVGLRADEGTVIVVKSALRQPWRFPRTIATRAPRR